MTTTATARPTTDPCPTVTTDGIRHTTPTETVFDYVYAGDVILLDGGAWVVESTGYSSTTEAIYADGRRVDDGMTAIIGRRADGHRVRFVGRPSERVMFAHIA